MANVLNSVLVTGITNNGGSGGYAYTVPASTLATLIGLSIANNSTTSAITVNVRILRGATTVNWVPPGAYIPVGGSMQCIGIEGKMVLKAGDIVQVIPSASSVDTIASMLEQS
jgi:hypothetical protein